MRQTLFYIPHEFAGLQVFGWGWLLIAWVIFTAILFSYLLIKQGWHQETMSYLPFVGIIGLAIIYILPQLEQPQAGLPIRGYGVMVLLGCLFGMLLAAKRAKRYQIPVESILSLVFWICLTGILGARVFYVVQKWNSIYDPNQSFFKTVSNIINISNGGLVVYGSLIGATLAILLYTYFNKQISLLPLLDLLIPSMVLGLALGRIGCLLNGCCFGAVCTLPWGLQFPLESPVYDYQFHNNKALLWGLDLKESSNQQVLLKRLLPPLSEQKTISADSLLLKINGKPIYSLAEVQHDLNHNRARYSLTFKDHASSKEQTLTLDFNSLPKKSRPVHPTQIYSATNALFLCLFLIFWSYYQRSQGEIVAWFLILYPISRFMLEIIRTDESEIWKTGLTISQNVSILLLLIGTLLWLKLLITSKNIPKCSLVKTDEAS